MRTRGADRVARSLSPAAAATIPTTRHTRRSSGPIITSPSKQASITAAIDPITPAMAKMSGRKRARISDVVVHRDVEPEVNESKHNMNINGASVETSNKRLRLTSVGLPTPPTTLPKKAAGHRHTLGSLDDHDIRLQPQTRFSLPAQFDSSPPFIEQRQFTPIRDGLDPRTRRHLKFRGLSETGNAYREEGRLFERKKDRLIRDQKAQIAALKLKLEERRQLDIDPSIFTEEHEAEAAKTRAIEDEIKALQKQVDDHEAQASNGEDTEDMELEISQIDDEILEIPDAQPEDTLDTTFGVDVHSHSDLSQLDDPATRTLIGSFETSLKEMTVEVAEEKSKLNAILIELRSLGFVDEGVTSQGVITCIIDAFRQSREETKSLFSAHVADLTNGQYLKLLGNTSISLSAQLARLDAEILQITEEKLSLEDAKEDVETQLESMSDKVSDLRRKFAKADAALDNVQRELVDLEDRLRASTEVCKTQAEQINVFKERMADLAQTVDDQRVAIERHRKNADSYYGELLSAQQSIERLTLDYTTQLEEQRSTLTKEIQDLQAQLETEVAARTTAEKDLVDTNKLVDEYAATIKAQEAELQDLKSGLSQLRAEFTQETAIRESAEETVRQKDAFISGLESQISRLETQVDGLLGEIELLRAKAETQRRQREDTEAELDLKNDSINTLNDELHKNAVQTNELRMKLFGLQQERDRQVEELAGRISTMEEQHTIDMTSEQEYRAAAEELAQRRGTDIKELELCIADKDRAAEKLQSSYRALSLKRDEEVAKLGSELSMSRSDYEILHGETSEIIQSLRVDVRSLSERLDHRDQLIRHLEAEKVEINHLRQAESQASQLTISQLEETVMEKSEIIADLELQKNSLEQRVTQEAEQMLVMMDKHRHEVAALKSTIASRHEEISNLQSHMQKTEDQHRLETDTKDREIESLTVVRNGLLSDRATLIKQNTWLKSTLNEFIAHNEIENQNNQQLFRETYGKLEDSVQQTQLRSHTLLGQIDEMEIVHDTDISQIISTTATKKFENVSTPQRLISALKAPAERTTVDTPFRNMISLLGFGSPSFSSSSPRLSKNMGNTKNKEKRRSVHFADQIGSDADVVPSSPSVRGGFLGEENIDDSGFFGSDPIEK